MENKEGKKTQNKSGLIRNQKGINHILLVSVHFSQHTFWPSCEFKKTKRWRLLGSDITSKQTIWTFVHECWCVMGAVHEKTELIVM